MHCFSKNHTSKKPHGEMTSHRRKFHMDLYNSINADEQKLCYLRYLIDDNYTFRDEDIDAIKKLNIKTKYFFLEDDDNTNNNIGQQLINNNQYINKLLPTYIIFKNNNKNKRKWKRITKKIIRNDLTSRNSIKFFKDQDEFNANLDNYVYNNTFQRDNIKVSLYGDSIEHKSIYKKLRIKYDFYYVNITEYETIQTKINFLKNKQLLELLGAEHIIIDRHNLSHTLNSHIVGMTQYSVDETLRLNNEQRDSEKKMDIYKYRLRKGFYSTVSDFMKKVDDDKYILLSREEIDMDFELKSLIGARIEKSLKEFNKVIRVSKITNKEQQLEILIKNAYGLSFSRKHNNKSMNFLKIKAVFYGVDMLYCIDEIPLTYDGFKILNDMTNGEKRKYINNFYLRVLKKNNCLSKHLAKIESIDNQTEPQQTYIDRANNINSYFNIEQLLEYLKDPNDVKLNSDGFDILRMCTINNPQTDYNMSKETFLRRIIKLNNIEWSLFELFIVNDKKISIKILINKKLKSFDNIRIYVIEFLSHPEYCSLNERGFYFVFNNNTTATFIHKKKILIKYVNRYLKYNANTNTNTDAHIPIIRNYMNTIDNKITNVIYDLDYFSFKYLLKFITYNDDTLDDNRILTSPLHRNSTPPIFNSQIQLRQETPELKYSINIATKEQLCLVSL